MKKAGLLLFVLAPTLLLGQTADFGDRAVELRGIEAHELAKPNIPQDAIATPAGQTIPRPLYLVKRYYSCIPWLRTHVRSVVSSCPGFDPATAEIDTGDDNPALQLVTEQNEARLELSPGTAANHPAYGLYCLKVRICVPWDQWQQGIYHRFYVRFFHRHPYVCWTDHWWYYWRSGLYAFFVNLNAAQEVPANSSPATGSGTLLLDPRTFRICYDINYSGLVDEWTASHIHSPASPGTNAGVLYPLNNIPTGPRAGRLYGLTPAYTSAQVAELRNIRQYVNIHTPQYRDGEIRGQIRPMDPVYCPWGPSWIPLHRWGRGGPIWCLTVTHPYNYPWDPWYQPRPFCLYGLRYYFASLQSVREPPTLPYIGNLGLNHQPISPWITHPKPVIRYWPYSPYCARWYWWRCVPFNIYRHVPPVVQYATWVNPDLQDLTPAPTFPDGPQPIEGTVGISTLRALVQQQGDLTGDGVVNISDLSAYRQEQNTASQDTADTDGTVAPAGKSRRSFSGQK